MHELTVSVCIPEGGSRGKEDRKTRGRQPEGRRERGTKGSGILCLTVPGPIGIIHQQNMPGFCSTYYPGGSE